MPAGHVDLGETPTASAVREVGEELGIELDPQKLRPVGTMFRRSLELRVEPDGQIERISYDQADPVALTRGFLSDPDRFRYHLFSDEG